MTAIIGPIYFFSMASQCWLILMIAVIGPSSLCTGQPMRVEQMLNDSHYLVLTELGFSKVFQILTIIGPIESY